MVASPLIMLRADICIIRSHQHGVDENLLEHAVPGEEAGEDILGEADLLSLLALPLEGDLGQPAVGGESGLLSVAAPPLTAGVTQLAQTKPEQR